MKYNTKEFFEEKFKSCDGVDSWGHQWRASQLFRMRMSVDIISTVMNNYNKKYLDIGCGFGDILSNIHKLFPKIQLYGCDISENSIYYNKQQHKNIAFSVNSLPELKYKENYFDYISTFEVIHYLPLLDRIKAIRRITKLLRQNGIYIYSESSINNNEEKDIINIMSKSYKIMLVKYNYSKLYGKVENILILGKNIAEKKINNINISEKKKNIFLIKVLHLFIRVIKEILKNMFIYKLFYFVSKNMFPKISKSHVFIVGIKREE